MHRGAFPCHKTTAHHIYYRGLLLSLEYRRSHGFFKPPFSFNFLVAFLCTHLKCNFLYDLFDKLLLIVMPLRTPLTFFLDFYMYLMGQLHTGCRIIGTNKLCCMLTSSVKCRWGKLWLRWPKLSFRGSFTSTQNHNARQGLGVKLEESTD